jgi:hypothetical protein
MRMTGNMKAWILEDCGQIRRRGLNKSSDPVAFPSEAIVQGQFSPRAARPKMSAAFSFRQPVGLARDLFPGSLAANPSRHFPTPTGC